MYLCWCRPVNWAVPTSKAPYQICYDVLTRIKSAAIGVPPRFPLSLFTAMRPTYLARLVLLKSFTCFCGQLWSCHIFAHRDLFFCRGSRKTCFRAGVDGLCFLEPLPLPLREEVEFDLLRCFAEAADEAEPPNDEADRDLA